MAQYAREDERGEVPVVTTGAGAAATALAVGPSDQETPTSVTVVEAGPGWSFNDPYSDRLALYMTEGWGASRPVALPPHPPIAALQGRRDRLRRWLTGAAGDGGAERDGPAVVAAGRPARRNDDQFHPFRAASDYVWLTGDQSPGGVLVLDPSGPSGDVLYVVPPARHGSPESYRDAANGELWVGRRPSLDALAEATGLACRPLDDLDAALATADRATVSAASDGLVAASTARLRRRDPDTALRRTLSELRIVKDEWEIEQLRHAVDATVRGFEDVRSHLRGRDGVSEREIEGVFSLRARTEGNGTGYHPVVAGGAHATILHWSRNDGRLAPDELLLLDAGVETCSLYTADVTRTFPVGGRFSSAERRVYECVLAAQDAALATLRAGVDYRAYYAASTRLLAEGLAELGVLPVSAEESLAPDCGLHRRWTLCAPGHLLGLDVHDCSKARDEHYLGGPLPAGAVLTVEPGLYFQANDELVPEELRGIGVRIEDDVAITADGYELLSGGLPRQPEDVEAWCGGSS